MNNSINEIKSIIQEIENTNVLLKTLLEGKDAMDSMMTKQFERKKRLLYRELAASLIQSELDVQHYEGLYLSIVAYLKKDKPNAALPIEIRESFSKAQQMLGY